MRRLALHLFTVCSAVSLLVCVACATFSAMDVRPTPSDAWPYTVGWDIWLPRAIHAGKPYYSATLLPGALLWSLTGILPAIWGATFIWEWHKKRRREDRGRCPACGYDLRASPECCPECGAMGMPLSALTEVTSPRLSSGSLSYAHMDDPRDAV